MAEAQAPNRSSDELNNTTLGANIVFFDSQCVLCESSVRFLLSLDKNKTLRFASLNGQTARDLLPANLISEGRPGTLVFFADNHQSLTESDAVVSLLKKLGGLSKLAGILLGSIPKPLRDLGYRIIAKNRFRFFGANVCGFSSTYDKNVFLP